MEDCTRDRIEKKYKALQKKYSLPDLKKIDEDFDISKIVEHESYTLLREIRKALLEKIISYMRFVELFINPSNAPLFCMFLVKGLDNNDKKIIEEVYTKLGEFEISALELDVNYEEKKEAEFIKDTYKKWQQVKKQMTLLSKSLKKSWKQKNQKRNSLHFG